MPRHVIHGLFALRLGRLSEAAAAGRLVAVFTKHGPLLAQRPAGEGVQETDPPVALRWHLLERAGIPRESFQVWRRRRRPKYTSLSTAKLTITAGVPRTDMFATGTVLELRVTVAQVASGGLVIEALDDDAAQVLPGQRVTLSSPGRALMRHPGIAGVRFRGQGSVVQIEGLDERGLANDDGWTLIEIVGLPYDTGEAALPEYDLQSQGFPAVPMSGTDAAELRLDIARLLQLEPPPSPVPGLSVPPWGHPDPAGFVKLVRGEVLTAVRSCLQATDDADPTAQQADFPIQFTLTGLRQIGQPSSTAGDPATFTISAPGLVALASAVDSVSATALGFGTIDLPIYQPLPSSNDVMPPGTLLLADEYMVTVKLTFPFVGTLELAAFGEVVPPPIAPTGLQAQGGFANRPLAADAPATQPVRLIFDPPDPRAAMGVVAAEAPGAERILNSERSSGVGGHDPLATLGPVAGQVRLTMPTRTVPVAGSRTITYLLAGIDAFGRWSPWKAATHLATAPPVAKPILNAFSIEPKRPLPAAGPVAPATMTIEFSWEWSDRTLEKVEFSGAFGPGPPATPAVPPGGFQLANAAAGGGSVVVGFGGGRTPTISSGHAGSVTALPSTHPPGHGDSTRYRLILTGASLSFASGGELHHAVTAVAYEHVRPSVASEPTEPIRASVGNPFPPPAPTLPIDVIWTALPDAAGRARAVLSWPAVAGADGYFVWEATETALRAAVGAAPPPASATVLDRVQSLRSLVTATATSQRQSLQAFSRMQDRRVKATSVELSLPGASDSLFAYRVSSVSPQDVESERSSTIAIVAVPVVNRPAPPRLQLRRVRTPVSGVEVTVAPGPGVTPATYEVHRVRRSFLAADLGTMGPPVVAGGAAGWTPGTIDIAGHQESGLRRVDSLAPSWATLYYRAVGIGEHDPALGRYGAASTASDVQEIVLAPGTPPSATIVSASASASGLISTVQSNLPAERTALGPATITLVALEPISGAPPRRVGLLTVATDALAPTPAVTTPVTAAAAWREPAGPAGELRVRVAFPPPTGTGGRGARLELTDPLGRTLLLELRS